MKNRAVRITVATALALIIFAAAFTAGFFTRKCTQGGTLSSIEWAIRTIEKNYYFGGAESGFAGASIDAIADVYLDRYSEYYTAEEYKALQASNAGKKSGLGVSYSYVKDRGVYIASVVGNSPAYKSGLRAGEFLTGGGAGARFDGGESFQSFLDGFGDGENFELTGSGGTVYTVAKSDYTASYAYLCTNSTAWIFSDSADGGLALCEKPSEKIKELPDGAAYVSLSQFYGGAAKEFFYLVEKFNSLSCATLVLDLRSNGGGYVDVMQEIAGAFSDGRKKLAMLSRDKHGKEEGYDCVPQKNAARRISKDVKTYVLANSGTASAAEALIGAMVCYGALDYANIFLSDYSAEYLSWLKDNGQEQKTCQTFGKGIMQTTFRNDKTGEALKLTTAKIYWPDGETCIHDRGVTLADGCTAVKAAWQRTLPDAELSAALEAIKSAL